MKGDKGQRRHKGRSLQWHQGQRRHQSRSLQWHQGQRDDHRDRLGGQGGHRPSELSLRVSGALHWLWSRRSLHWTQVHCIGRGVRERVYCMLRCDLIIGKLVVILCCWVLLGVIELLFRSRWESNPSSCSDKIEIPFDLLRVRLAMFGVLYRIACICFDVIHFSYLQVISRLSL